MRTALALVLAVLLAAACSARPDAAPVPSIVPAAWVRAHRSDVVLVDMQTKPEMYAAGHIDGAVYAPVGHFRDDAHNMLPVPEIERRLGALGIDADTTVVLYDQAGGRHCGYLWFVLDQLGHQRMALLDGGLADFAGELVAGAPPVPEPRTYVARARPDQIVDTAWVAANRDEVFLLDVRPEEQYTGAEPKAGLRAGHIPGAVNVRWDALIGDDGHFVSDEAARAALSFVPRDRPVVVYCNTYHQASHMHFHLERLGWTNVKAYDGSVSDWQSDPERPLTTGDRP